MEGSSGSLGASPLSSSGTPRSAGAKSPSAQVNIGPFMSAPLYSGAYANRLDPFSGAASAGASPLTASSTPSVAPSAAAPSAAAPSLAEAPSVVQAAPSPALPAPSAAAPSVANKKKVEKRKNLMANIEERARMEGYVPTTKNLKNLRDKVEFFNKKGVPAGSELARKHEKAKELLARIEKIQGAPALTTRRKTTAKLPVGNTALRANLAAGGSTLAGNFAAVPTGRRSPLAETLNSVPLIATTASPRRSETAGAAGAEGAEPSGFRLVNAPMTLKRMTAKRRAALERLRARVPTPWPSRRGETVGQSPLSPSPLNLGAPMASEATAIRRLLATPLLSEKPVNTTRKSKYSLNFNDPEYRKYLIGVIPRFLPLPEMYNPYTGEKYGPDESPLEDIENAYLELKGIRNEARRLALKMQKESAKRALARQGTKRKNGRN